MLLTGITKLLREIPFSLLIFLFIYFYFIYIYIYISIYIFHSFFFFNRRVLYSTPEIQQNPVFENWQRTSRMKGGIINNRKWGVEVWLASALLERMQFFSLRGVWSRHGKTA